MGCVYLLGDWEKEGVYKIGVTRGSVDRRIKKLQTGNSGEIYLVSYYETKHPFLMEKMLHMRYHMSRVMNEWFSLGNDDVIHFRTICREVESNIEALEDNYYFKKKFGEK